LLALPATPAELLHVQNEIINALICMLMLERTIFKDQVDDYCDDALGKLTSLKSRKLYSFVRVSINYSHQLAKVICFKTPDDFKLFP
jgi:hypothetical protein